MTAATVTNYDVPIPGFAAGSAVLQDAYTLDTGLGDTVAFFATASTADTSIEIASQSGGIITIRAETAGTAVSVDETIYWFAVRKSR